MKHTTLKEKQEKKEMEDLKIETVEQTDEFRELNNIFKGEGKQGMEAEENTGEFEKFKEIDELLEDGRPAEEEELEDTDAVKLSEDDENLADSEEIGAIVSELPEPPEPLELEVEFEDEPQIDIEQLPALEDIEREQADAAKTVAAKTGAAKKNGKTGEKEKTPVEKISGLDLFERLQDKTRLTVIKKVHAPDSELIIDIKDKDSRVLESIKVIINPETRKVNLILDVEK